MTFSAPGGRDELLSAGTLKLLKCKEGGGEGTAGCLAVSVITQNEQSRWLGDAMVLNVEEGAGCTWNPTLLCCIERN